MCHVAHPYRQRDAVSTWSSNPTSLAGDVYYGSYRKWESVQRGTLSPIFISPDLEGLAAPFSELHSQGVVSTERLEFAKLLIGMYTESRGSTARAESECVPNAVLGYVQSS